jgi:hydroxypyruvate isomerase
MTSGLRVVANCSLLFTEFDLLQRCVAARDAGFSSVEFWWPFREPSPDADSVDAFVSSVKKSGVRLVGLNFFAGDLEGPDCGILSMPSRVGEFRRSVDVAIGMGRELNVTVFNALYGNLDREVRPGVQDETALANLEYAARRAAEVKARVVLEPISGPKPYVLRRADDVMTIVRRVRGVGLTNVGMLLDTYHLESNGDSVMSAISRYAKDIFHVQIADVPGRGEPGTGMSNIRGYIGALMRQDYRGAIALEYRPTTSTIDSLAWLRDGDSGLAPLDRVLG